MYSTHTTGGVLCFSQSIGSRFCMVMSLSHATTLIHGHVYCMLTTGLNAFGHWLGDESSWLAKAMTMVLFHHLPSRFQKHMVRCCVPSTHNASHTLPVITPVLLTSQA